MSVLTVTQLFVHPVKSMRGVQKLAAHARQPGFEGDRQWLVTDADGHFITARELEALLLWQPQQTAQGLSLVAPDGQAIEARVQDYTSPFEVTVWRDTFEAYRGPAGVDAWLSAQLGRPSHLVFLGHAPKRRYAPSEGALSFADGAPFLLCSEASLAALNAQLDEPVVMRRFRPNIVVDGLEAYAEDAWARLQIGDVQFSVYKPCSRCKIVNLDPETAALSERKEPLKTLAQTHKLPEGACFGMNLYAHSEGMVRVGDRVQLLERGGVNGAF